MHACRHTAVVCALFLWGSIVNAGFNFCSHPPSLLAFSARFVVAGGCVPWLWALFALESKGALRADAGDGGQADLFQHGTAMAAALWLTRSPASKQESLGLFRFPSGASRFLQHLVPKLERSMTPKSITRMGSFSVVPMWSLRKKTREVCNPMCLCDSLIPSMCLSGNI